MYLAFPALAVVYVAYDGYLLSLDVGHDDVGAGAPFEIGGEMCVVDAVPDDFDDDYFGDETHDDVDELDVDCICCDPFFFLPLIVQHRDSQHLLHILQQDVVQT